MTQQQFDAAPSPFSLGGVIGASLALLRRHFWSLFAIAVAIGVPLLALSFVLARLAVSMAPVGTPIATAGLPGILVTTLVTVVTVLTYLLIQAGVSTGVLQNLRGERPAVGRCIARSLALLPHLAAAVVLLFVAMAVVTFAVVMICYLAAMGIGTATGAPQALRYVPPVSAIVVFVLAMYWFVGWWVFVPVMVVEKLGAIAALRRSRRLTQGHRWSILGIVILVFIANFVCGVVVGLIGALGIVATATLLNVVLALAFTAFSAALTAVGYTTLRAEKESFGRCDLAQVFE